MFIPFEKFKSLEPSAWILSGAGISREDIKDALLKKNKFIASECIFSVADFCSKILDVSNSQILSRLSRQEILKKIINDPRVGDSLVELKKLKRRRNFIKKIDQAIQKGRMSFFSWEEELVYSQRLQERFAVSFSKEIEHYGIRRNEIRLLAQAYETWLKVDDLWDEPRLLFEATERLRGRWGFYKKPNEIYYLSLQKPESREKALLEVISQHVSVHEKILSEVETGAELGAGEEVRANKEVGASAEPGVPYSESGAGAEPGNIENESKIIYEQWHTFDDACESFSDRVIASKEFNQHTILLPDDRDLWVILERVLNKHRIPQRNPRSPIAIKLDESLKLAFLPLMLVAKDFPLPLVCEFVRFFHSDQNSFNTIIQKCSDCGIQRGLKNYNREELKPLYELFILLKERFPTRVCLNDLKNAHLFYLFQTQMFEEIALQQIEQFWNSLESDYKKFHNLEKKIPLLFWITQIQTRMDQETPLPHPFSSPEGLSLYRLDQVNVCATEIENLWILGLPDQWLESVNTSDEWFSERERESLSSEFLIRSGLQIQKERLAALRFWLSRAKNVIFLDAHYSWNGKERMSLLPTLKELDIDCEHIILKEPGAHPRWKNSFFHSELIQPQIVSLSPKPDLVIRGGELDRYSRCPFQALAGYRWKLEDLKLPEPTLRPDVRGVLVHEALSVLMKNFKLEKGFLLSPQEALEIVWKKKKKGFLKTSWVEEYEKKKILERLEVFCLKEVEYQKRVKPKLLFIEEDRTPFQIEWPEGVVRGRPDRIDEVEEGVFVIDYKTSSQVPHGSDIFYKSYALQLPLYMLMAEKIYSKPAIGAQFIQLDKKGTRSSGLFFKEYNGKETIGLTMARKNSKSLLELNRLEVLKKIETMIRAHIKDLNQGFYSPIPKKDQECLTCSYIDLCGKKRKIESFNDTGIDTGIDTDANTDSDINTAISINSDTNNKDFEFGKNPSKFKNKKVNKK